MAAAIMMNAANVAYRKAVKKTRDKGNLQKTHPLWMSHFAERLVPDQQENASIKETVFDKKERLLSNSNDVYEKLAWLVFRDIVNQSWFEVFVMCNILLIGVATGLDLESNGGSSSISAFVNISTILTTVVFSVECVLKLITEAYQPQVYFLDPENGAFNTFDFAIAVAGLAFVGNTNGGTLGALRMMRLIRLLTFIKSVPQLRVIISGLVQGMKSVTYIVMLLFLVIYMFAIMGCLLFGSNDPARFGTVPMAMVSLFQVSTLASWTSIAYTSWFGCGNFYGDQYTAGGAHPFETNPSTIHTSAGDFEGYKCDAPEASPVSTFFFFSIYILLTSWVIMSLFIGVISMGMFEAFQDLKVENREIRYRVRLDKNMSMGGDDDDDEESPEMGSVEEKCADPNDRKQKSPPARKVTKKDESESLRAKMDYILEDEHIERVYNSLADKSFADAATACLVVREKAAFNNLITFTILIVGLVIGDDTNKFMRCERLNHRLSYRDDDAGTAMKQASCRDNQLSSVTLLISQIIFTVECGIKIVAEGYQPLNYFTNKKDGNWNCMDFFVVFMGYVEMSPLSFIFDVFPVIILRLLRLLRVFRLAKALPRLRSIVEALISGFSAVGWICVLIVVFNYIVACMCMLFLQENDPFHFGSVGRAMFTVLRIETLDTWDQTLYISMFGCSSYPAGYPMLDEVLNPNPQCKNSQGLGWGTAIIFFVVVIIGSYILPTVLIGIVAISFDEAARRAASIEEMNGGMKKVVKNASDSLPGFFTVERLAAIHDVFSLMDADDELSLDLNEISPFLHYGFGKLFGVALNHDHIEALFHLMDRDGLTELRFADFVSFVVVIKQIESKCKLDPDFRRSSFPDSDFSLNEQEIVKRRKSMWKQAVQRMDEDAMEEAWDTLFSFLGQGDSEEGYNPAQIQKVQDLFEGYDADGNGALGVRELTAGLVSCGVLFNERQSEALICILDANKDGEVSFAELLSMLAGVRKRREVADIKKEVDAAQALLGTSQVELPPPENLSPDLGNAHRPPPAKVSEVNKEQVKASACLGLFGSVPSSSNQQDFFPVETDDGNCSLESVIEMCVERVANRMVLESTRLNHENAKIAANKRLEEGAAETTTTYTSTQTDNDERLRDSNSTKNTGLTKTLKKVLKDRVTKEFSFFHRLESDDKSTIQGGASRFFDMVESPEGTQEQEFPGGRENDVSDLMTRTLQITRGAPSQSTASLHVPSQPQQQQAQLSANYKERGDGGLSHLSQSNKTREPPPTLLSRRGTVAPREQDEFAKFWDATENGLLRARGNAPLHRRRSEANAEGRTSLNPLNSGSPRIIVGQVGPHRISSLRQSPHNREKWTGTARSGGISLDKGPKVRPQQPPRAGFRSDPYSLPSPLATSSPPLSPATLKTSEISRRLSASMPRDGFKKSGSSSLPPRISSVAKGSNASEIGKLPGRRLKAPITSDQGRTNAPSPNRTAHMKSSSTQSYTAPYDDDPGMCL